MISDVTVGLLDTVAPKSTIIAFYVITPVASE